jgi:hypothetical protein
VQWWEKANADVRAQSDELNTRLEGLSKTLEGLLLDS